MTEFRFFDEKRFKETKDVWSSAHQTAAVHAAALLEIAFQLKRIADKIEGGEKE